MRKHILTVALMAGICSLAISISLARQHLPAADADQLWNYITVENAYQKWGFWPGHQGMYPGKSPHGAFLKLYANPPALKAARQGEPLPDGSILVKENYGEDRKTLKALTPMYKVKGYNPEGGDWFWAKYGPDGKVIAAGKVESCINCHRGGRTRDYVFTKAE